MREQLYSFTFEVFDGIDGLGTGDAYLLQQARSVTANAYAPYSNFLVGAAARLVNNQVVTGSNQENASFPAGICAERVLLATAASLYPNIGIHTLAVSYNNIYGHSSQPASPCGICRQSLLELEQRTQSPIRLILAGLTGQVYVLPKISILLPLAFDNKHLERTPL